ncbi:DUF485 domain-containing protein [Streptomyces fructofermentans]|uniref:DUF485 domain-containing protein n=1 Tax=Streptomyces fructofermentans TaxID=152141 RepID=A0A918NDU6_9ACTN|nr:DUF485 domain-containing protein [Streptomyces fructofermentans]GGX59888.1 hypothetical protein GCM10010515_29990 [Streptomyces fructofermentans]
MQRHSSRHHERPAGRTPSGARNTVASRPDFQVVRGARRRIGVTAMSVSVGGFLLFVLASLFLPEVLGRPLVGHVTLGLAAAAGQFVVMALTVWRYTAHMKRRVDPTVDRLRAELRRDAERRTRTPRQERRFGAW